MQQQIDSGISWCRSCDAFGIGTFCGKCGRRFQWNDHTWRKCPGCKSNTIMDYCPFCGDKVATDWQKRVELGQVDWAEEVNEATQMLNRIFDRRPDLIEQEPPRPGASRARFPTPAEITRAINESARHG